MSDEENTNVEEEVVDPSESEDSVQAQDVSPQVEEAKGAEYNWRETREVMRLQQNRIAELEQFVKSQPQAQERDELDEVPEDELLTKAQSRQLAERLTKKAVNEALDKREKEGQEEKMAAQHDDYYDVVGKYIPELIKDDPTLKQTILAAPNKYAAAYQIAKKSHLYHQDQVPKAKSNDAARLQKNLAKPQSSNAAGKSSSLSDATNLQSMTNEQIWEMSERYAQGR